MQPLLKAHYSLSEIKDLLRHKKTRLITQQARKDAVALGFITDQDVIDRCLLVTEKDFYKTMLSTKIQGLWQDVYKTSSDNDNLYIKFQKNYNGTIGVVISFKLRD